MTYISCWYLFWYNRIKFYWLLKTVLSDIVNQVVIYCGCLEIILFFSRDIMISMLFYGWGFILIGNGLIAIFRRLLLRIVLGRLLSPDILLSLRGNLRGLLSQAAEIYGKLRRSRSEGRNLLFSCRLSRDICPILPSEMRGAPWNWSGGTPSSLYLFHVCPCRIPWPHRTRDRFGREWPVSVRRQRWRCLCFCSSRWCWECRGLKNHWQGIGTIRGKVSYEWNVSSWWLCLWHCFHQLSAFEKAFLQRSRSGLWYFSVVLVLGWSIQQEFSEFYS